MTIEVLIANLTVVGSPVVTESAPFWISFDIIFDDLGHVCDLRKPLCDLEIPSWALKT